MDSKHFRLTIPKTGVADCRPCGMARKIALGTLAATLIATSAVPVFAARPDQHRHGGHHAQQQEQEASAVGKRRGTKSKTVRKTFTNGESIAIPDIGAADLYPSPIAVSGFKKGKITDVNLTLRGFSHVFPLDVNMMLVAPGGRIAVVLSDVGGNLADAEVTDLTLRLDDEAAILLPADERLTSGSFRPLNDAAGDKFPAPAPTPDEKSALSTFDGLNPNGQWQLFIDDDSGPDGGVLTGGWSLEITAKSKARNMNKKQRKR